MGGGNNPALDFLLVMTLGGALGVGVMGSACGGLTSGQGDHVEVSNKDCIECHKTDYDNTTSPAHSGMFPLTCADCHDTTAWSPAHWSHPWPLDGAHATTPCTSCHLGNPPVYKGTPTDCYSCHQADFDGTTSPTHPGLFDPGICSTCHDTVTWTDFSHPWFKIPHKGVANECADCHNPAYSETDFKANQDCTGAGSGKGGCHSSRNGPN